MSIVLGGIFMVTICLNMYYLLKRRVKATLVSDILPEVHYDDIESIYDNSTRVPVLLNNV